MWWILIGLLFGIIGALVAAGIIDFLEKILSEELNLILLGPKGGGKDTLKKLLIKCAEKSVEEGKLKSNKNYQPTMDKEEIKIRLTKLIKIINTPGTIKSVSNPIGLKSYDILQEIKNSNKQKYFIYIIGLDLWKNKRNEIIKVIKRDLAFICEHKLCRGNYFTIFLNKTDIYPKSEKEIEEEFRNVPEIGGFLQRIEQESVKYSYIIGSLYKNPKKVLEEVISIIKM